MFGSSVALFYIAGNSKFSFENGNVRSVNILCVALAIFIPCFIAGVRNITIGYVICRYMVTYSSNIRVDFHRILDIFIHIFILKDSANLSHISVLDRTIEIYIILHCNF